MSSFETDTRIVMAADDHSCGWSAPPPHQYPWLIRNISVWPNLSCIWRREKTECFFLIGFKSSFCEGRTWRVKGKPDKINRDQNVCQRTFKKKNCSFSWSLGWPLCVRGWKCPQEVSQTSEEAVDKLPVNWGFVYVLQAERNRWA